MSYKGLNDANNITNFTSCEYLHDENDIEINLPKSLKHMSIIMDGNARWASFHNYNIYHGHLMGSKVTKNIIDLCVKIKLQHLSLYLFSIENWNRPKDEINNIFTIYLDYLTSEDEILKLQKQNIKVLFLGSKQNLDTILIEKMENIQYLTQNNTGLNLYILFNYSGREELTDATKKIAIHFAKFIQEEMLNKNNKLELLNLENIAEKQINAEFLQDNMYAINMPQIDLLIRTGNRNRVSNILPFHISYAEILFLEILWPDFKGKDLKHCIETLYNEKIRTFGKRYV